MPTATQPLRARVCTQSAALLHLDVSNLPYLTARGPRVCLFGAQWAGLALAGNAAKDMAVSIRSPKTKDEAQSACKMAGWSWLAGSAFRRVRCAALLRASRFHSRTTRGLCS